MSEIVASEQPETAQDEQRVIATVTGVTPEMTVKPEVQAKLSFDPTKYLAPLGNKPGAGLYLKVQHRLVWLRDIEPDASVITEPVAVDDKRAFFKATVSLKSGAIATGFGSCAAAKFGEYIEKAETKAIGRALAALGFGTAFAAELDDADSIADAPVDNYRKPAPQAPRQQAPQPAPRPLPAKPAMPPAADAAPKAPRPPLTDAAFDNLLKRCDAMQQVNQSVDAIKSYANEFRGRMSAAHKATMRLYLEALAPPDDEPVGEIDPESVPF